MDERTINQLNNYIDNPDSDIRQVKQDVPPNDHDVFQTAGLLKRTSPRVVPSASFNRNLQSKLLSNFSASHNAPQEKKTMNNIQWKLFASAGVAAILLVLIAFGLNSIGTPIVKNTNSVSLGGALPHFASCSALEKTLQDNNDKFNYGREEGMVFGLGTMPAPTKSTSDLATPQSTTDYSQTNVQVAGVDEADTVKTDGTYIYTIAGSQVFIALANPPAEAAVASKISITNGTPSEIFLEGKNLLVFGSRYSTIEYDEPTMKKVAPDYYPGSRNMTFVQIYNVSNPEQPILKRTLEFDGSYATARKIDNYVYFVLNSYPDYRLLNDTTTSNVIPPVPVYRDLQGATLTKTDTPYQQITKCTDVAYIEPISSNQYLTVVGLPIDDYNAPVSKEVILGSSQNVYASLQNLYIANTTWQEYATGLKQLFSGSTSEKTNLYKFSLAKDKIKYEGQTTVPGTILNQFSMDEYRSYFRIATTTGHVSQAGGNATNNVYVLDANLKQVGALTDLAPGEKFYSTRFMGDRAYLVTFQKVDPLFTVDLSDPTNPKVLGQLKIPGYSDYLHPYDDTHLIGIGKDAVASETGNFAWYQGLKLAIFDVSDVTKPKELFNTVIGDRGTNSPVLSDHKAFLFSREKNLLVLPVSLAELTPEQKANTNTAANTYGTFVFQGSYVFNITLDKGFILKGRITHDETSDTLKKSGSYYGSGSSSITRNLYIDNVLYSLSSKKILANDLTDLQELKSINLQ